MPLAQPETSITPMPVPRTRSQFSRITDDDRTSQGADSLILDYHPGDDIIDDSKFIVEMKETNG